MLISSSSAFAPGLEAQMMDVEISEDTAEINLVANIEAENGVIMVVANASEIYINGTIPERSMRKGVWRFFTGVFKEGEKFVIRVVGAARRQIKITALFFKKMTEEMWKKHSCDGCKFVLKTAISLLLHQIGATSLLYLPHPEIFARIAADTERGIDITAQIKHGVSVLNDKNSEIGKSEIGEFFRNLPFWGYIVGVFSKFDFVRQKIEEIYEETCGAFHCCPQG